MLIFHCHESFRGGRCRKPVVAVKVQVLISGSSTIDYVKNPPIPALKKDISLWRSKWRNGTSVQIPVKFKFVCFSIFGLDNLPIRTSRFWGNPDLVDSFWIAEAQHSLRFGGRNHCSRSRRGFLWDKLRPFRQKIYYAKDTYHSYASCDTVDGRNAAPVEVGCVSHYLQGFFTSQVVSQISSINCIFPTILCRGYITFQEGTWFLLLVWRVSSAGNPCFF